jgi:hypothetical protein
VNKWWISDDTRYSYKIIKHEKRLKRIRRNQFGAQIDAKFEGALDYAMHELKALVTANGAGGLLAMLSPMMACEEAWLLGQAIRKFDPEAVLVLGPVPAAAADDVFKDYVTGKQTFVIKAEKVPNAAGIRRVIAMLGGPSATFDELGSSARPDLAKLKGGWIVGGYLSNWTSGQLPEALKKGFRVVQDILPSSLTESADVLFPAAAWAEKGGCWENFQGKIQPFAAAVAPPLGVRCEGDVYYKLLGRSGLYDAASIRSEMGEPFASLALPTESETAPSPQFVEL